MKKSNQKRNEFVRQVLLNKTFQKPICHSSPVTDIDAAAVDAKKNENNKTRVKRSLTHVGSFCLKTETPEQPTIQSVAIFLEKPVSIESIKRKLEENILSNEDYYRFHSIVDEKSNCFLYTEVNVENHVHMAHIYDENGALYGGTRNEDDAFIDLLSDITSKPLQRDRPLWEIVLIDDYYSKGFVLLWRIHHVIGDGSAMILCCSSLFHKDAVQKIADIVKQQTEEKAQLKSAPEQYVWYNRVIKRIYVFLFVLWFIFGTFRIIIKWIYGAFVGFDPQTVVKREPGLKPKGKKRVAFNFNAISVDEAKKVSRTVNSTINDLMLCCLAGAIDKYTVYKNREVKRVNIRVTTPVNIRTSITEFKVPRNKFGFMVSNLPLGINNTVERLKWIKKEMDYNKQLPERYFSYIIGYIVQKLFPMKLIIRLYGYMSYLQSVVVTNICSPPGQVEIDGIKANCCVAMTPLPPGVSLGVAILSYNNNINVAITTDQDVISDPEHLLQYFMEEYSLLKKACRE
jgi:diacylglycerol O-acyltransferase